MLVTRKEFEEYKQKIAIDLLRIEMKYCELKYGPIAILSERIKKINNIESYLNIELKKTQESVKYVKKAKKCQK